LYFLYLELLLSSFAVHFFYSWEIDPGLCLWKRRKICSNFWFGWIICWTRWWGLPKSDPTMMRTEFTLRSNTFAADGSFSSPPYIAAQFCLFYLTLSTFFIKHANRSKNSTQEKKVFLSCTRHQNC
jgi:hypothetical protein